MNGGFSLRRLLAAVVCLCAGCGLLAGCGFPALWSVGAPVVAAVAAVVCFAVGLREKGRLLHGGIALLGAVILQLLLLCLQVPVYGSAVVAAVAAGVGAVLFCLLFALRPKKMCAQLAAYFQL